jgi:uncharacterized membrane-anchored protein YhcB (DUF1043 family)
MAAKTEVTAQLLRNFERQLKEQASRFDSIERNMDNLLNKGGFLFDDPVAHRFRALYAEKMNPLRSKLLPAMDKYQNYLRVLAEKTEKFTQD